MLYMYVLVQILETQLKRQMKALCTRTTGAIFSKHTLYSMSKTRKASGCGQKSKKDPEPYCEKYK
jgi:hypothetical protein